MFVLKVYVKAWYTCRNPVTAPRNDLELIKQLVAYKATNEPVATAAMKSFSRHLWYLSETLVGLSFFDSVVTVDTKLAVIESLKSPGCAEPLRRIEVEESELPLCALSSFATTNTMKLFTALDIDSDFLHHPPDTWDTNVNFQAARRRVASLQVVNDAAERGVALIQTFNSILTNQEEQKQYLL